MGEEEETELEILSMVLLGFPHKMTTDLKTFGTDGKDFNSPVFS